MTIISIIRIRRRQKVAPSSASLQCRPSGWRLRQLNTKLRTLSNRSSRKEHNSVEGILLFRGNALIVSVYKQMSVSQWTVKDKFVMDASNSDRPFLRIKVSCVISQTRCSEDWKLILPSTSGLSYFSLFWDFVSILNLLIYHPGS
jgi:hypothetical protein